MKLYRHLAWDGIRKNSRLYVPYLLTGVGAVSFFYILVALARLPEGTLPGSGSVQVILNLGSFVLWVFSLLLLFYTHSFLIRRRNREFALYNVLGMGKGDISRILCWESLLSGGLSLLGGLALGVVLSKLAELGLMRVMGLEADMTYRVSAGGLLMALTWFFAAVLMVIAATYLLFISGSVTLCRLLQRNPRFYYRKRHFVSVSSLVYRMKRNGAGLASICILGTMVLVMLSSTTCLYFGAEDSLRTRYPRAENVTVWYTDREDLYRDHSDLHAAVVTAARSRGAQMQDLREYRSSSSALTVRNGVLQGAGGSISDAVQFTAIPLSDYNAAMGARLTLSPGQVYICHGRSDYRESTLSFPGGAAWQVKGLVDNLASGGDSASIVTQLTAIVPDEEIADMDRLMEGMNTGVSRSWSCGFDLGQEPARDEGDPVAAAIREALESRQDDIRFNVESLSENRDDFYGSYGSLFFLGILLSVGFSLAAVLIIYYKQISEGYEDQARFDIMQKVGMTRRDIRSSINSQLLLVFFLPLLLAGLHLVFAFPFVHKLLLLFNLWNTRLLVGTTAASFLAFAVLYTLVYRATSTAYYHIVSDGGDR